MKYALEKKGETTKTRQMLEGNVLRKIVGKTKVDRIRGLQIRDFFGIQPFNEWV